MKSYIVYSSDVSTDHALTLACELGLTDMMQNVALYLRNIIAEAFEKSKDLPRPPTDDFLRKSDVLPGQLKTFLNYLLSGRAEDYAAKVQRIVSSLGQDICKAVTKGQQRGFILFAFSSASSPPEIVL